MVHRTDGEQKSNACLNWSTMWVDAYVLRSRKRSLRVEEHAGTVNFGAKLGFLKGKITYPLADMQMWCLPSAEFATLQGPKFDCFYVPLALYRPFATVHESDTHARLRPLVAFLSKRFPILSVITLHLAASIALSFSTRF